MLPRRSRALGSLFMLRGLGLGMTRLITGRTQVSGILDPAKAEELSAGRSYIKHIPDTMIAEMLAKGFVATADVAQLAAADAILICVPTPLNRNREPDLSFI